MKQMRMLLATIVVLLFLTSCGGQAKSQQRFVPVSYNWWYAALDTKTGQICKTFKWKDDAYPDRTQGLPECLELYERFPDR